LRFFETHSKLFAIRLRCNPCFHEFASFVYKYIGNG